MFLFGSVVRKESRALLTKRFLCTVPRHEQYLKSVTPLPKFGENANVPPTVASLVGRGLHLRESHPLGIIKGLIEDHFKANHVDAATNRPLFETIDTLSPVVSVEQNFDSLLTPKDHPSRSPSDTYFIDADRLLRCHTSCHQAELLAAGRDAFLCTGDVYRRDTVDRSHYPVFHQMEGVRVFRDGDGTGVGSGAAVAEDLRGTLEGLVRAVFGDVEMRWVDAYFPFTEPSLELEIFWGGEWLEVLGCGNVQPEILRRAGYETGRDGPGAWAFGLGLERLAMVLFGIPDIRLFWTRDERFLSQFSAGEITTFEPYSKFPPCYKDVSFWIDDAGSFHENDVHEIARGVAGDLCESVETVDDFTHPKTRKRSLCFRINYRSMDRSLTNEEVDRLQVQVRDRIAAQLPVTLR